jgi:hypothetical protein
LLSDIPTGDGKIGNLFLQCICACCRGGDPSKNAADDEDEEALPEEEENRPILPYSSFFILSSTNP